MDLHFAFISRLLAFAILMDIYVTFGQAGGYTNFHCPMKSESGKLVLECAEDCKLQHGADFGYCGNVTMGDYNCYCDGRSGRVYQRSNLQCKEMTKNLFD